MPLRTRVFIDYLVEKLSPGLRGWSSPLVITDYSRCTGSEVTPSTATGS